MIYQASLLGFLRMVLIILAVYYVAKIVFRFLLPLILNNFLKRTEQKFNKTYPNQPNRSTKQKEGETVIDTIPPQTKSREIEGDYVDFEEIE